MSFTAEVKDELSRVMPKRACCPKAELSALIRVGQDFDRDSLARAVGSKGYHAPLARRETRVGGAIEE